MSSTGCMSAHVVLDEFRIEFSASCDPLRRVSHPCGDVDGVELVARLAAHLAQEEKARVRSVPETSNSCRPCHQDPHRGHRTPAGTSPASSTTLLTVTMCRRRQQGLQIAIKASDIIHSAASENGAATSFPQVVHRGAARRANSSR